MNLIQTLEKEAVEAFAASTRISPNFALAIRCALVFASLKATADTYPEF